MNLFNTKHTYLFFMYGDEVGKIGLLLFSLKRVLLVVEAVKGKGIKV